MIVPVLPTKPFGLYRHRRGLELHRVGYGEGDLTSESSILPSTPGRVPSGDGAKSSILSLHSPTVRPKYIVRQSGYPLIQDSLNRHRRKLEVVSLAVIRLADGNGTADAGSPLKAAGRDRVERAAEEESEAVGEPIVRLRVMA